MKISNKKTIYNKSLDLLARQDYSKHKLKLKLLSLKYDEDEVFTTITKLVSLGFINEYEYARRRIKLYIEKGQGQKLIHMNIESERIDIEPEEVEIIFESLCPDVVEQIQLLIANKCRYLKIDKDSNSDLYLKQKQKIMRFLVSKGHPFEISQQYLNQYFIDAQSDTSSPQYIR